ncbi:MAG: ATPase [Acidobacteria bacterium]|nr:ATPase [Acidobacteriota bacterium]MCB9398931.1 ATPase [Acidobacteriota bacterium]
MAIGLILIWLFFAFATDNFLSPRNLTMLSIEVAVTATLALGMLLVLLPGMIDLSVGSGVGMIGGIAAVLIFRLDWSAGWSMVVGMVVGILVWTGMGALIAKQRIPSFIITLGGLLVFKGLFWKIISSETVPVVAGGQENALSILTTYYLPTWAGSLLLVLLLALMVSLQWRKRKSRARHGFPLEPLPLTWLKGLITFQACLLAVLVLNQFQGIPLALLVLLGVAAGVHVLIQHTRFGRYLYAIGGNREAALLSGVPIDRVIIGAFGALGLIVALSGYLQTAYSGASTTTIGNLMELDAIAACVIGGTSLSGGRGHVLGVLIGAVIMATLLNGMTLMAVAPETKFIARGTVLALAVWMDIRLSKS